MYLCRLVGDSFCLCVDHRRLFGTHLDCIKTLMDKKAKWAQIRACRGRTAAPKPSVLKFKKLPCLKQTAVGVYC